MHDKNHITIQDVLSHYHIIGAATGFAIGISGKDLVYSLLNDIVFPSIGKIHSNGVTKGYIFDPYKFLTRLFTFIIIFMIVLFLLYVVLRPMVRKEIVGDRKTRNYLHDSLDAIITYTKGIDDKVGQTNNNIQEQNEHIGRKAALFSL